MIGTDPLSPDTDGGGSDDGEEVRRMGTEPLDSLDLTPTPAPEPPEVLLLVAGAAFLSVLYRQRIRRKTDRSHAIRRVDLTHRLS